MRRPSRSASTRPRPRTDEWLIGFGAVAGDATLSASGDPIEAAAHLFDLLHEADAAPQPRIAVAPIPGHGIAAAIRDRLKRAAAPRIKKGAAEAAPSLCTPEAKRLFAAAAPVQPLAATSAAGTHVSCRSCLSGRNGNSLDCGRSSSRLNRGRRPEPA